MAADAPTRYEVCAAKGLGEVLVGADFVLGGFLRILGEGVRGEGGDEDEGWGAHRGWWPVPSLFLGRVGVGVTVAVKDRREIRIAADDRRVGL